MSTTRTSRNANAAVSESTRPTDVNVTMVTTPGDGSCGIGTYARDLLDGIDAIESESVHISQEDRSVGHFLSLAVRAVRGTGDVVHVQHEYGLFRREGSKYHGIMGLVFFPVLFLLARLRSKHVVVTMHSVLKPTPDESPLSARLYLIVMHKLLAMGAGHLIFLSPDCASKFRADIDLDDAEYSVLSHGVNTDVPGVSNQSDAKRAFGFDPDDDVVAIPGFVRPPKGHDIFVELARALPDYEFVIAGGARPKGEDFEFAERIREEAPENVTVTGVLDDEAYWTALAAPDLAVLPYRVVTQSGTFNSCATRELPVLASDADYFRRIEAKWGAPATVDIEDTSTLVERVQSLLEDDAARERLAERMTQYKRANSFERVGADHCRIYHHVASGTVDALGEPASDAGRSDPLLGACSAGRGTPSDD